MRKASQEPSYDNYIEQKLQGAFGYSDDQLLTEFAQAEAQPEDPDLLPPKDEWRKLLERVNDAEKKKQEDHKVLRLKRIAKPLILVAVLGVILVGTGIGASGKRGFEYWTRELSGSGNRVIWNNNEDNLVLEEAEDEAYNKVKDTLGIDVIVLDYLPKEIVFQELKLFKNEARMGFSSEDAYVNLLQILYEVENSTNIIVDKDPYKKVYNANLDRDISIGRNILSTGKIEYDAIIKQGKAFYHITASVEEEEFIKIIKKVRYHN